MNKIPFSPPDIGEAEINEVVEALKSGWITTGPRTKKFENRISEYLFGSETGRCVCLNSWTACAEMVLRLIDLRPGDEVITTAYTYTATAAVALHIAGVRLVLVDVEENSLRMDKAKLYDAITDKTKVIIPVDVGGVPEDYDEIFRIVEEKKTLFRPQTVLQEAIGRVIVLEDAAHAFGAKYKGKMIGGIADFTCFSFHAVKNLTTAEGGALVWKNISGLDDSEIYKNIQLLSLHGQSKDAFNKSKLGAWEYDIIGTWYKCNMTDIQSAIGIEQLERYDKMLTIRSALIKEYNHVLDNEKVSVLLHDEVGFVSSKHLFITRVVGCTEQKRNEIIEKMAEDGIATNVHYKPLPLFTAYKALGFDIKDYPRAFDYYINEITLPLYSRLTTEQVKYIAEKYMSTIKKIVY